MLFSQARSSDLFCTLFDQPGTLNSLTERLVNNAGQATAREVNQQLSQSCDLHLYELTKR